MLRPNFCCQEFGESCLISITYLNNLKMKIQYAENGFKYWWIIHPSCGHQHESMAWWLSIRCFSDNIDTYPNLFISFLYCVALSQSVDSRTPFQILCMYWEVTYHWQQICFGVKRKILMEFTRTCYLPKPRLLLCSIFPKINHSLVSE